MKKLIMIAVVLGLAYYFKPHWFSPITRPFASGAVDGQVVLFTYTDCGNYCKDAVNLLNAKNIPYEHYDIHASTENEKMWRKMGGGDRFPVLHVGGTKLQGIDRSQWIHALAKAHGVEVFDADQRAIIRTHFNADGSPKVVMYATAWCPYCKKAREFFAEKGIAYTEIDVEKSAEGGRSYRTLNASGYPLIYIGVNRFDGFGGSVPRDILKVL